MRTSHRRGARANIVTYFWGRHKNNGRQYFHVAMVLRAYERVDIEIPPPGVLCELRVKSQSLESGAAAEAVALVQPTTLWTTNTQDYKQPQR